MKITKSINAVLPCLRNSILSIWLNIFSMIFFLTIITFVPTSKVYAQGEIKFKPTDNPVAPSVYQFLKLTEMPVNEYSGQPNISIPIYTVKSGSVVFPLTLQYQTGGIKVNEEASCVGLGWSLPIGNIVQVVQDRDDLDNSIIKILPDYFEGYNYPRLFPPYKDCHTNIINDDLPPNSGINVPYHQWVIYQDYYVPINGDYEYLVGFFTQNGCTGGGALDCYDSEPDMFKLNVNGHQLNFILDKDLNIKLLNDIGGLYKLSFVDPTDPTRGFKCITPAGETYIFDQSSEVRNELTSIDGSLNTSSFENFDMTSRIWHLTRITDPNGNLIDLKYSSTEIIRNLPTVSQKFKNFATPTETHLCADEINNWIDKLDNLGIISAQTYIETYKTYTNQYNLYCDTIRFNDGYLKFGYSNRQDIVNDKKLDNIKLYTDKNELIQTIHFNYLYNISTQSISSSSINLYNKKTEQELRYRLLLNSLIFNNDQPYSFRYYGLEDLPPKLSYCVDYWGYPNGVTANSNWIPNPIHIGLQSVPDNLQDHRPNIEFAKSGTLSKIIYPTKLERRLTYELHHYLPSVNNADDTIGNGLRIKSVASVSEGLLLDSCVYTYYGGKIQASNQFIISSTYELVKKDGICCKEYCSDRLLDFVFPYTCINSSSFFHISSYTNLGNIGYSKVDKQYFSESGLSNGKIVKNFVNNNLNKSIAYNVDMVLPTLPNYYQHSNGSVTSEQYYNSENVKVKETLYDYTSQSSPLYYGAKVNFYKLNSCPYVEYTANNGSFVHYDIKSLDIIGYYPIYDRVSFPISTQTITWTNGIPVIEKTKFNYDDRFQVSWKKVYLSNGDSVTTFYKYPYSHNSGCYPAIVYRNMIAQPNLIHIFNNDNNTIDYKEIKYALFASDLILPSQVNTILVSTPPRIDGIYDEYDEKGNLLMWHTPDLQYNSLQYNESKTQLIASCQNSKMNESGFTSFEDGETNGWIKFPVNTILNDAGQAHSGKYYITPNADYGPYQVFDVGLEADNHSGYKASVWVKGSQNAFIHIEVNGVWSTHVRKTNTEGGTGWNLLEVIIPKENFRDYMGSSLQLKVYVGGDANALFDDLRFFPADGSMTSYTYKPLIGISSESDSKNIMTTYEYDSQGRLRLVRDHDGNILKKYEYNYAQ